MKEWLTIVEAAERLNITPYTLRMWIKRGKITASKQGAAGLRAGLAVGVTVQWRTDGNTV